MAKSIDWESRIGRRLRLRDLHILFTVVECGSMAKAGAQLRVTQPAISKAIGDLEAAVGVRLLDRSPRGIEPTEYGRALLKSGLAAFDELRNGVRGIEFLADPDVGEVRFATTEMVMDGILLPVIERFTLQHPKIRLHQLHTSTHAEGYAALHERRADMVITLSVDYAFGQTEELQTEVLFHDRICLAAAAQSSWAKQRDISFADLANAVFIAPPADTPGGSALNEAFRAAGLPAPHVVLTTFSVHARNVLPGMADRFVAVLPVSVLRFNPGRYPLKELPLELPIPTQPRPVVCATLKHRTLRPAVECFIACLREVSGAMQPRPRTTKPR